MNWIDIASIVFVCVTANHLGLVKAIEEKFEKELPIINCCKCFSFWATFIYTIFVTHGLITSLAVSFLASYSAIWLELLEGFIDTLYLKLYGKITEADNDNEATTSADDGNTAGTMPEL